MQSPLYRLHLLYEIQIRHKRETSRNPGTRGLRFLSADSNNIVPCSYLTLLVYF